MQYEITQHFTFTNIYPHEFMIKIENQNILVIFGRHVNGYFMAFPQLNISCEAAAPSAISKNTVYLTQAGIRSDYAYCISQAIREEWKEN